MDKKEEQSTVDKLLARLNEQQQIFARQKQQLDQNSDGEGSTSTTDATFTTPATESAISSKHGRPDAAEFIRLKKELELAQQRMAQMDLELTQSRIAKHTVEEAIGSPFPTAQQLAFNHLTSQGTLLSHNNFTAHAQAVPKGHTFQGPGPGHGLRIDTTVSTGNDIYTPQL